MNYDQLLIRHLRSNLEDFCDVQQKLSVILEALPANLAAIDQFQLLQASEAIEEILDTQEVTKNWLKQFKAQSNQEDQRSDAELLGNRTSIAFYEYFCSHCGYSIAEEDVGADLLGKQPTCPHDQKNLTFRLQKQP